MEIKAFNKIIARYNQDTTLMQFGKDVEDVWKNN
jgi:hypothetical protein